MLISAYLIGLNENLKKKKTYIKVTNVSIKIEQFVFDTVI